MIQLVIKNVLQKKKKKKNFYHIFPTTFLIKRKMDFGNYCHKEAILKCNLAKLNTNFSKLIMNVEKLISHSGVVYFSSLFHICVKIETVESRVEIV